MLATPTLPNSTHTNFSKVPNFGKVDWSIDYLSGRSSVSITPLLPQTPNSKSSSHPRYWQTDNSIPLVQIIQMDRSNGFKPRHLPDNK